MMSTSAGPVAYDSHGSGDPIVLLPSGGHDHHDYDELRGLLPGRFRSISIDWPGHGRSPAGTMPATELTLAQLVEELLDSLAPAGAVLVGNSIGGNVATRLAIRRPDLVKGLVIIDGGMGSQLQAEGVPMDDVAWSARTNLDQPEADQVRAVPGRVRTGISAEVAARSASLPPGAVPLAAPTATGSGPATARGPAEPLPLALSAARVP